MRNVTAISVGLILMLHAHASFAQTASAPANSPSSLDRKKLALHFQLLADGGAIEMVAKELTPDKRSEIARDICDNFMRGNFDLPLFSTPSAAPNVSVLKKQTSAYKYKIEQGSDRIRIRISTADAVARAALHNFLRFEITAQQTGDSLAAPISSDRPIPGRELGRDANLIRPEHSPTPEQ